MSNDKLPTILSIDTSCDETSAAVTYGPIVFSNIVWSQSNIHAKFGGVVPVTARREHERKISWVVKRAVDSANIKYNNLDAISVTVGPGLAIALGVGINYAKEMAIKLNKPLIAINHLEGHVLSTLAVNNLKDKRLKSKNVSSQQPALKYQRPTFPAFGTIVSGGNTLLILIEKIGKYKVLAQTIDDALGESLDKSARLLGLGYPGGAILEKFAKRGNSNFFPLPIPMLGRESEGSYSYSGLKTAFYRLVEKSSENNNLTKLQVNNLAASYQNTAFEHFIRVTRFVILNHRSPSTKHLLIGGGVTVNAEFRKRIRIMCKELLLTPLFPYTKKLCGDNAAMIGVSAYFKYLRKDFSDPGKIDRLPNLKIDHTP